MSPCLEMKSVAEASALIDDDRHQRAHSTMSPSDPDTSMAFEHHAIDVPALEASSATQEEACPQDAPRGTYSPEILAGRSKVNLDEALRILRLQNHTSQRRWKLQKQLRSWQVWTALSARLVRCVDGARRGLAHFLNTRDKPNFVSLYQTLHEVHRSCNTVWQTGFQGIDDASLESPEIDSISTSSFMSRLPTDSRTTVLHLLERLRDDPHFLADRICALSTVQLSHLIAPRRSVDFNEPTLSNTSRGRNQASVSEQPPARCLTPKETFLAFERGDPLSALLFNLFSVQLGVSASESRLRLETWSNVCTRLVLDGRPGGFELVANVLSSLSGSGEWRAKANIELYLMKTLQEGAFLLESVQSMPGFGPESSTTDFLQTDFAQDFFEKAVEDLFHVLDDAHGGLPLGALEIGTAILGKLEGTDNQRTFRKFLIFNWFFSSYLWTALIFPEVPLHFLVILPPAYFFCFRKKP